MDRATSEKRDTARGERPASIGLVQASEPRKDVRPRFVLRRFLGASLEIYWFMLFAATHVPVPEGPMPIRGADKLVHFAGYGVLGSLLAFWLALTRPLSARVLIMAMLLLGTYGAIDEWLQIPAGRSCEFSDWVCDVLGGGFGIMVIASLSRLHPRLRATPDDESTTETAL